jgi:hypothetical protein
LVLSATASGRALLEARAMYPLKRRITGEIASSFTEDSLRR